MQVAKKIRKQSATCEVCHEVKSVDEFLAEHVGRLRICKSCKSHVNRLGRYHIDPDAYETLLKSQNYRCAICESELELERNKSVIDHDHKTNEVRGILCRECNSGLGKFRDSNGLLAQAAKYLIAPPARGLFTPTKIRKKYEYVRQYLKAKRCGTL